MGFAKGALSKRRKNGMTSPTSTTFPTIKADIGFNLILFTKRLILEDYLIQFTGFFIATVKSVH
jgi:hypothetical protein